MERYGGHNLAHRAIARLGKTVLIDRVTRLLPPDLRFESGIRYLDYLRAQNMDAIILHDVPPRLQGSKNGEQDDLSPSSIHDLQAKENNPMASKLIF